MNTNRYSNVDKQIDRASLARRHNPKISVADPRAPLQVGNGRFAFAADPTGFQTFPQHYPVAPSGTLLGTQSQWGWHSLPNPNGYELSDSYRMYSTPAGEVPYIDLSVEHHDAADQSESDSWLRGNPHRIDLGQIGLWCDTELVLEELGEIEQELDLWTGTITSRFLHNGIRFAVTTAVHPERDVVAFCVQTSESTPVGMHMSFAYGSPDWGNAADWSNPAAHETTIDRSGDGWHFDRTLDGCSYSVTVRTDLDDVDTLGRHDFAIRGTGGFVASVEFGQATPDLPVPSAEDVFAAAATHWQGFWERGAAVELAGSDDPRAHELERRVVLSQYVTAVNCANDMPPAETGLMLNSWRGKFHLEMHWFHGAHFALWGRDDILVRQLGWYDTILAPARETARRQQLPGVRWPKQVDPSGNDTPSNIGPFLVWQQPQPIYLAELLYRSSPTSDVIERWIEIVVETAEFMAAFAASGTDGFELGPPIIPSQESYYSTRSTAKNPTFELAFWAWALDVACRWCERAGRAVPDRWRDVARHMAPPKQIDGIYAALATEPYLERNDHPSMLAGLGVLPETNVIDPAVMGRTFDDVWSDWDWQSTWGWDYPVAAMTATRLGRPEDAVAALLMDTPKNLHLVNGHNRQTDELPIYLPGNGSLLSAMALMTAGWDGSQTECPGFGSGWNVEFENMLKLP